MSIIAVTEVRKTVSADFAIETTDTLKSYYGGTFIPNHASVVVRNGVVSRITLDRVHENGWPVDDPDGPDGAVLAADFGGGEFDAPHRDNLPPLVLQILALIETL